MKTRRVKEKVSLDEARRRLRAFEKEHPGRTWSPSSLADVIWPDNKFLNAQGAGRAAAGVLKRLKVPYVGWPEGYCLDLDWDADPEQGPCLACKPGQGCALGFDYCPGYELVGND